MMKPTHIAALFAAVVTATLTASSNTPVTFIAGAETTAAFAKGRPLVETSAYKVHASRRDGPGGVEIHTLDTDIFYILDGTATIVTGGRGVGMKDTAPTERRGTSIDGGASQRLVKGDVFIVPNGVPHQFTEVQAPFLYYTVKVTASAGGGQ